MSTFISELVALLIILFIIVRYILPRIQAPLRARQALIRKQVEDAEQAKRDLAEAQRAYQNAVTESRTEAAQIRENARAEAQRTVEELSTQAQQESARIVARGEEQLASQRASIIRELRGEIGTLAVELSDKILTERLAQDQEVSATVDAFISELESRDERAHGNGTTAGAGTGASALGSPGA